MAFKEFTEIDPVGMNVEQLHELTGQLIKEGKKEFEIWYPASKRPHSPTGYFTYDEDSHILIK